MFPARIELQVSVAELPGRMTTGFARSVISGRSQGPGSDGGVIAAIDGNVGVGIGVGAAAVMECLHPNGASAKKRTIQLVQCGITSMTCGPFYRWPPQLKLFLWRWIEISRMRCSSDCRPGFPVIV